ncbi:5'-nucleotidase [Sediminihabitans luteus]|uniref:5'-nucleotidase n=1 Tax=Sediminihabitans luteus TaxID=1138585 RepID=A0A2M9D0A3_9CELL|nr:5'/3'-nucleotidase SurE [Sediminihabitans luteus]PJJ77590.1 5'-nucleotidase [Sediminihabitans luteus]GII98490.1 5'/3'-nucleotidase SurE [Sediminihabitans luteus]
MRALITNDDGIMSEGLAVLAASAVEAGYEVVVAAPARESSGASASLLGAEKDGRLVVESVRAPGLPDGVTSLAVRAAPALIAFVAAYGGFGPKPDLVLSGVNKGANTGNAVLHSGTVGAALSATTHGITSVAVSIDAAAPTHWDTARRVTDHGLAWATSHDLAGRVLNLNVPDLPLDRVRGLRQAPLATFGAVSARIHQDDDRNLTLRYTGTDASGEPESDAGLLVRGWATATLLRAPFADVSAVFPGFGPVAGQ